MLEYSVPLDSRDHWVVRSAAAVCKTWLKLTQLSLQRLATAIVQRLDAPAVRLPRERHRLTLLLENVGTQFYSHPLTIREAKSTKSTECEATPDTRARREPVTPEPSAP